MSKDSKNDVAALCERLKGTHNLPGSQLAVDIIAALERLTEEVEALADCLEQEQAWRKEATAKQEHLAAENAELREDNARLNKRRDEWLQAFNDRSDELRRAEAALGPALEVVARAEAERDQYRRDAELCRIILREIRAWDQLPMTADGPYWMGRIDAAIIAIEERAERAEQQAGECAAGYATIGWTKPSIRHSAPN